jgi:hypothetical protein
MKMGTTRSPWRYDVDAEIAIGTTIMRGVCRGHAPTVNPGVDSPPVASDSMVGSIHPPPAPFWDGERIAFLRTLALANGSARQAPISSVRR